VRARGGHQPGAAPSLRVAPDPEALAAFRNRLAKNARHWSKWARRRGYGAYRVYDRDLPEFPLAIDCYVAEDPAIGTRIHLQEIDTGWQQDESERDAWRERIRDATAEVLALPPEAVVIKHRMRRQGKEQHAKTGARGLDFVVVEAGLRFRVNLEAYLDTGLFLDHRLLRALVRERAAGRRMLNLFAYTGSFTVYAAAGGAIASDTVDLSNTYLDWAAANFALNGLDPARHALIRADATAWLDVARAEGRRYGLVVLDPPAFSNSKAMTGVLDVQRDHPALVAAARRLLAPGGELFFSTNLRTFRLDPGLAADPAVTDITAQTLPEDFRDRRVHHAFRIAGPAESPRGSPGSSPPGGGRSNPPGRPGGR
jgi:23S rRNA (cytosine1962-C5)-methyltransferase